MTCKYPTCSNDVGQQDRDDYRKRTFCCIQHEVKFEHVKMDAKDAQESVKEEADTKEAYF